MTDEELRDKLASEYWQDVMGGPVHGECFKAGWDAARANPYPSEGGVRAEVFFNMLNDTQKEIDQLRAEVERLRAAYEDVYARLTNALNEPVGKVIRQRDELKTAAEKLAEALDSCMWVDSEKAEVTGIARKALAEYREKFKKD